MQLPHLEQSSSLSSTKSAGELPAAPPPLPVKNPASKGFPKVQSGIIQLCRLIAASLPAKPVRKFRSKNLPGLKIPLGSFLRFRFRKSDAAAFPNLRFKNGE